MRLARPLLALGLLAASLPAPAQGPTLAEPLGEQCVEPTQVMRERHWQFLMHQRDETVHRGIRTTRHSLRQCLECHVRPDAQGRYPRSSDERHFCTTCHVYAAVKVDCFECHADRPQDAYGRAPSPARLTLDDLARGRP